jgi:hypothetical protein
MSEESDKLREFIQPGSEIAGGVVSTAIGLISAGTGGLDGSYHLLRIEMNTIRRAE